MRTTAEENRRFARWIAGKLNRAEAPFTVLIPERGVSALDCPASRFLTLRPTPPLRRARVGRRAWPRAPGPCVFLTTSTTRPSPRPWWNVAGACHGSDESMSESRAADHGAFAQEVAGGCRSSVEAPARV